MMYNMQRRVFVLSLTVVLLVAVILRFFQLGQVPVSLYWDEAAILVDAKAVAETGRDMHGRVWYQVMYPSYGDYKLPGLIWLSSLAVKIFGVSEWAVRVPSAIAGVITVVLAGLIARRLAELSKTSRVMTDMFQLCTMLVVAVSPWSVLFSRTAFEGHIAQMWVAVSVWAALSTSRKPWLAVVAAVFGGLATYTYFSVRFVWPVVWVGTQLLQLDWHTLWTRKSWSRLGKMAVVLVVGLVVFGLMLVPMLRSPLYEDSNRFRLGTDSVLHTDDEVLQSNIYRELAGNTVVDRFMFHRAWLTGRELLKNYADHLSLEYLFISGDPNLRHGTGNHGVFTLVWLPVFLIGLYQLYSQRKTVFLFLMAWWLIALLPASVPETTPHALRSLNALVPVSLVIGWGTAWLLAWLWSQRQVWSKLLLVGWAAAVGICTAEFAYYYFNVYPANSAPEWQYGYKEVAKKTFELRGERKLPIFVEPFDDRFYLWVMGYGPYTGQEFAQWPESAYQFQQFDGLYFTGFPGWGQVTSDAGQAILVTTSERLDETLHKHAFSAGTTETIYSPQGEPLYSITEIKPL